MGTKCAPSDTNAFMGSFEENFIFSLLTNLSEFHLRFTEWHISIGMEEKHNLKFTPQFLK